MRQEEGFVGHGRQGCRGCERRCRPAAPAQGGSGDGGDHPGRQEARGDRQVPPARQAERQGWPNYEADNLGTKPVTFLAIYGYAYDKDGKQVAHTKTPLSWNGKIAPGGKTDFDIQLGGFPEDQVPATADSYEVCYDSMEFEGDKDFTNITDHCPDQKAKGK